MSRRRIVELLVGLLLAGVSFLAVLYGVNESMAARGDDGGVPQMICPLH